MFIKGTLLEKVLECQKKIWKGGEREVLNDLKNKLEIIFLGRGQGLKKTIGQGG